MLDKNYMPYPKALLSIIIFWFSVTTTFGQQDANTHYKIPLKPNYRVSTISPYKMSLKTDLTIGLLGSSLYISSALFERNSVGLTIEDVATRDRNDIWIVDRFATGTYNKNAAKASDIIFSTSMALPVLFVFDKKIRKDYRSGILYAEALLVTGALTSFTKAIAGRPRPYTYNKSIADDRKTTTETTKSFFSGHTSMTAAATFFMATLYTEHHPDSRFKPLIWTLAAVVPFTTGALRVAAGKHYLTDVTVGYAIGASVGYLVPYLHKRIHTKRHRSLNVRRL